MGVNHIFLMKFLQSCQDSTVVIVYTILRKKEVKKREHAIKKGFFDVIIGSVYNGLQEGEGNLHECFTYVKFLLPATQLLYSTGI